MANLEINCIVVSDAAVYMQVEWVLDFNELLWPQQRKIHPVISWAADRMLQAGPKHLSPAG